MWHMTKHLKPTEIKKEIERMLDCIEFGERYEI